MKRPAIHLETRQKLLLGGTGALVALVLAARFLYLPVVARIGERRVALTDLRVKTADAHLLAARLADEERTLTEAQAQHRALERRAGGGQSVARILETLSQQAKDHRLELVAVQPREEDESETRTLTLGPELTLQEIPLRLQLTGRYRQIGEFLGGLIHTPFISSVRELRMRKPEAGSATLQADLVLAVYLAKEPGS